MRSTSDRDPMRDLELLLTAHHALIVLETNEEARADALLEHLADRLGLPYFVWNHAKGLARRRSSDGPAYGTVEPKACLDHIEGSNPEAIYHLTNFVQHAAEPPILARLKALSARLSKHRGALVLTGTETQLPPDLEPLAAVIALAPPSEREYYDFVRDVLRDLRTRMPVAVHLNAEDVAQLLANLKGLTLFEVKKILTQAIVQNRTLDRDAIQKVLDAKRRVIERTGVLEYFPIETTMADVAGLANLKTWLRKRKGAFTQPDEAKRFGLTAPKGILLLGVQGCGKSLSAKAVAAEWTLPLIRLDPSNLYQKYLGESEKNLKRAIKTAESMAPIVLWIDEIEKAFGQGGEDGGAAQRVFGTFLSWMQEKRADVFVIATSNDISKLPPELLRKGRFDEIFFVDLPSATVRREILEVHLRRRDRRPEGFALDALVDATEGFSGAELEQAVVSALYTAFAAKSELETAHLLDEIGRTKPLSVLMREKIDALREWARERTVPAD